MKLLDLTLPSPAENLACDEALLDAAEAGDGGEILRFWEPREHFVVVGYANKVATEVNVAACEARGIPILRRCSGGGTVVQGPGCLNYTLVLRITADGPLHNIGVANQFIMRQNRAAIATLNPQPLGAAKRGGDGSTLNVAIRGHTDLAIGERKFSGNSQRRRKLFLLFHGTFLLHFNLALVSELLPMPSKQPDYRESPRAHRISDQLERASGESEGGVATGLEGGRNPEKPTFGKNYGFGARQIRHAGMELQILIRNP